MAEQTTDGADPDDPAELDAMADRLEAALDQIVLHVNATRAAPAGPVAAPEPVTAALAARLDGLIGKLRDALGEPAGYKPD